MKKSIFISLLLVAAPVMLFAQLKVSPSGNVGIGLSANPTSKLALGGVGNQYAKSYFEGNGYVIDVKTLGKSSNMGSSLYGIGVRISGAPQTTSGNVGIESKISGSYTSSNKFVAGIIGMASNGANGYNYGVSGYLSGGKNGAGIFGSVGGNGHSTEIPGRFAGFYEGDMGIYGNIYLYRNHLYHLGNIGFMQGVQPMSSMLHRVTSLNPIVYKMAGLADSTFAFSGQDVASIFPQLVNSDYHVDYTSLVPILVKAIKELNQKVEVLQSQLSRSAPDIALSSSSIKNGNSTYAFLYQNSPNPFKERTTIRFTLPYDITNAHICIYDMSGKKFKHIPIDGSMDSVSIDSFEFLPGIYLYSLVADGVEIDTKRMVITK